MVSSVLAMKGSHVMSGSFLIRSQGNLADIQGDFTENLKAELERSLTYTHVVQNRGVAAYKGGSYQPFVYEERSLYKYGQTGNLVFMRGFLKKIKGICEKFGFEVEVRNFVNNGLNPERFAYSFERIFERMELKAKQDECLASIVSNDCGIIVAPTGFGKSFLFAAICLLFYNARIHIVTRRKDVMKRLLRHLVKFVPNVGQVGAGKKEWGRVTVITADSLHLVDHRVSNCADIVLYDEVHEAAAPSYKDELSKYQHARMYGFTATPEGRFDNAHFVLEGLFGPHIFKMSYQEAVSNGLVLPVKVEWLDISMQNPCEGMKEVVKERWGIWRNKTRNSMIAAKARQFSDDDQILILVRTLDHAIHLKQELPEFKLCYDSIDPSDYEKCVNKGMLDTVNEPAMTPAIRDKMSKDFEAGTLKKVIATDVWSTGVDFPMLSVLIRADARASEIMDIQAPGRVVRRHDASGKEHGIVIDCLDSFDPGFKKRSFERKKTYDEQGWEQSFPKRKK